MSEAKPGAIVVRKSDGQVCWVANNTNLMVGDKVESTLWRPREFRHATIDDLPFVTTLPTKEQDNA
ncbi:hypothetical protein [Maritalea mobilis]|nr:hypothetical protein [Maritalea mobilis]